MSKELGNQVVIATAAAKGIMDAIAEANCDGAHEQIQNFADWIDAVWCRPEEFATLETGGFIPAMANGSIGSAVQENIDSHNKAVNGMGEALGAVIELIRKGDFASAQNVAWFLTGQVFPINAAHQAICSLTELWFGVWHLGQESWGPGKI